MLMRLRSLSSPTKHPCPQKPSSLSALCGILYWNPCTSCSVSHFLRSILSMISWAETHFCWRSKTQLFGVFTLLEDVRVQKQQLLAHGIHVWKWVFSLCLRMCSHNSCCFSCVLKLLFVFVFVFCLLDLHWSGAETQNYWPSKHSKAELGFTKSTNWLLMVFNEIVMKVDSEIVHYRSGAYTCFLGLLISPTVMNLFLHESHCNINCLFLALFLFLFLRLSEMYTPAFNISCRYWMVFEGFEHNWVDWSLKEMCGLSCESLLSDIHGLLQNELCTNLRTYWWKLHDEMGSMPYTLSLVFQIFSVKWNDGFEEMFVKTITQ